MPDPLVKTVGILAMQTQPWPPSHPFHFLWTSTQRARLSSLRLTMADAGQQPLWLSAAFVQAGLPTYIAEATAWMNSEKAVAADFTRSNTIDDLGNDLKLTKTQVQRLRSKIEALSPDSIPLPGVEASLRDKSPEEDNDHTTTRRPRSPTRADLNQSTATPSRPAAASAPAPAMLPPPSAKTRYRLCAVHNKQRDQSKMYQLTNGDYACKKPFECMSGPPQSNVTKEADRAPNPQRTKAGSSRRPSRGSRRSRDRSRSRSRTRRGHRRRSPSNPVRPRQLSPGHSTLTSPLSIADSLFQTMDSNPSRLKLTSDGFYRLKDLMGTWGKKHQLSKEEVLSAIACSLFKVVKKAHRANFLIWQNDDLDADILLSIPAAAVR